MRPVRPLAVLLTAPLGLACPEGSDAGSGPVALTTTAGSSSTGVDPIDPTSKTPTTGATDPGIDSTSTTTTTTTSPTSGEVETGGASSTTTDLPPSPSCGDGKLDPGEMCDPGAAELDDYGACTLECVLARCGDQLIWAGIENCDDGTNNNDEHYGGCTTQCKLGPRCNDGAIQGPEECDLADDNGTGKYPENSVPCDNGCRFQARIGFISSVAYKGGDLGGVEGADLKCQGLAKLAKFDNAASFKAWLSDAQHSPHQDFNHAANTEDLAYVRPDGVRIADDWDDLILNGPGDGIIVTETGEKLLSAGVWTGTAPSGKAFDPSATCKAWSSTALVDKSRAGLSGVDKQQPKAWMQ